MIKIILTGCCGKMGKVISDNIKNFPNLQIVSGIDKFSKDNMTYPVFSTIEECTVKADVVLDFSRPEALDDLIKYCKINHLPLVLCTTGYDDNQLNKINESSSQIPVFHSANMSIGINLISNILNDISEMLHKNYDIEIIEKHHNQKVDSPSGTALLLANSIKNSISEEMIFKNGREGISKREPNEIGIHAIRGGSIVGEHQVIFAGPGEIIELKHTALSREVFATGALKACDYMQGKEIGMYSMNDVIKNS